MSLLFFLRKSKVGSLIDNFCIIILQIIPHPKDQTYCPVEESVDQYDPDPRLRPEYDRRHLPLRIPPPGGCAPAWVNMKKSNRMYCVE